MKARGAAALLTLATAASLLLGACGTALSAAELADGCAERHQTGDYARGVQEQMMTNPVRFEDRVAGGDVCLEGEIQIIDWPDQEDRRTTIYVKSIRGPGVACRISRTEAAEIEQYAEIEFRGIVSPETVRYRSLRALLLESCRLERVNGTGVGSVSGNTRGSGRWD